MSSINDNKNRLKHAVVKLINGEELICMVDKSVLQHFGEYQKSNEYVTLHYPMKASVEQFIEKENPNPQGSEGDGHGENIVMYEKTIMTSWIRFAYITAAPIVSSNIIVVAEPDERTCNKYDDLVLKYDTYKTNPELAEQLFGGDYIEEDEDDDD